MHTEDTNQTEQPAMGLEKAQADINRWLDRKKVPQYRRDELKDSINKLVCEVSDGRLVVEEGCVLTYTLQFPEDAGIQKLEFKPRISGDAISIRTSKLKASDADGRMTAYICAITGQVEGIIKKLDTSTDLSICQSIANFFT